MAAEDFPETVYADVVIDAAFAQTGDGDDLYQHDGRRKALADKIREALNAIDGLEVHQVSVNGFLV